MAEYIKERKLGSGSYGNVYSAIDNLGNKVAIKRNLRDKNTNSFMGNIKELDLMAKLKGFPHIICLNDVIWKNPFKEDNMSPIQDNNLEDDSIHFVLEKMDGDLSELRKLELTKDEMKNVLFQCCIAVHYIHYNGIIHRDIKPENYLYKKRSNILVKLTDFGLSKPSKPSSPCVYTSYYRPPEVASIQNKGEYSYPADIWALACTLYELVTTKVLVYFRIGRGNGRLNRENIILKTLYSGVEEKVKMSIIDEELKHLLLHMLNINPEDRYTIDEIIMHPYFKDVYNSIDKVIPYYNNEEVKIITHQCMERIIAMDLFLHVYNNYIKGDKEIKKWLTYEGLFLGMDIFDRYLNYIIQTTPKEFIENKIEDYEQKIGKYMNFDDITLLCLICLYMGVKYYKTTIPYKDIITGLFSDSDHIKMAEKKEIEIIIAFNCIIYRKNLYDIYPNKIQEIMRYYTRLESATINLSDIII